jgi:hypothetical protein
MVDDHGGAFPGEGGGDGFPDPTGRTRDNGNFVA